MSPRNAGTRETVLAAAEELFARKGYELVSLRVTFFPTAHWSPHRRTEGGLEMQPNERSTSSEYPVQFSVEYPDRDLNRLTTALRLIVAIPILILIATLGGGAWGGVGDEASRGAAVGAGGLLFLPVLLMIVFRQKYPRWWYDWNLELLRFTIRVGAYLALMDDRYPSTEERQAVSLDFPYPDAREGLNRWLPLVKWLLAIPHYVVLFFLFVGAVVSILVAWFAILFTGRYPRGLFDYLVGVGRWSNRVTAYGFLMVTDRYPPFRLSP